MGFQQFFNIFFLQWEIHQTDSFSQIFLASTKWHCVGKRHFASKKARPGLLGQPHVADLLDRIIERAGDQRVQECSLCYESSNSLVGSTVLMPFKLLPLINRSLNSPNCMVLPIHLPTLMRRPEGTDVHASAICALEHIFFSLSQAPSVDTNALLTHFLLNFCDCSFIH